MFSSEFPSDGCNDPRQSKCFVSVNGNQEFPTQVKSSKLIFFT